MSALSEVRPMGEAAARYRRGLLFVTLSAVAWSTAGFFTRLIPLDAWTILFWRGIFGALTGLVFVLRIERGNAWRAFLRMGWPGLLFTLLSTAGMLTFIGALKLTTVAHVAIVYATVPFIAAGLAWIVLREPASPGVLTASLVAVAGVAVTVFNGLGEGRASGDVLALLMSLFMAAIIVIVRRSRVSIPMIPAACLSALLGACVSLPFASPLSAGPVDLLNLSAFGISNMGLGLILFTIGARLIPAGQTALIGALDAPLAPIWVWLAFAETPKTTTIIGGGAVLLAVVGHIVYENRRLRSHAA